MPLARTIKKEGKCKLLITGMKKITIAPFGIKGIVKEYYVKYYASKFGTSDETDYFLKEQVTRNDTRKRKKRPL